MRRPNILKPQDFLLEPIAEMVVGLVALVDSFL